MVSLEYCTSVPIKLECSNIALLSFYPKPSSKVCRCLKALTLSLGYASMSFSNSLENSEPVPDALCIADFRNLTAIGSIYGCYASVLSRSVVTKHSVKMKTWYSLYAGTIGTTCDDYFRLFRFSRFCSLSVSAIPSNMTRVSSHTWELKLVRPWLSYARLVLTSVWPLLA